MGRTTHTLLGAKAKQAILDGVNAIVAPVQKTLGPNGINALLYRTFNRGSRITNDGWTVAETQEPKNPFVRLAAQSFKESCRRTNERVGDGTTTTVVVAGKLFNDVYKILSENQSALTAKTTSKSSPMAIKKTILKEAEKIKEQVLKASKKVKSLEELEKIATVSVEDEDLGKIIAKMAWETGVDGFIDVVEGYKGEIETEVIKGMRFPAKVAAKAFVNNPNRYEMVATDCPVLITNYALDNVAEFIDAFKEINRKTSKLIVIAPSFSENVLVNMVAAVKQGFFLYPVAVPSLRTDQFDDLSVYCGAKFIDKAKGNKLKNARPEDLGFLEKLIVKDTEAKEEAVATGGAGTKNEPSPITKDDVGFNNKDEAKLTPIQERINILKGQLAETKQEQFKKLLQRRIASISSAVGVIRVGDSTEASSLYRKLKIDDAVYACKAALRGGYVKGGGLCLKELADKLPEDNILKGALVAPYEQIQSSFDGGLEIPDTVIDPAECVYYAVEFATSVVSNLITVDVITIEDEDPIHGEAEFEIAKAIKAYDRTQKIHFGQLKENQEEVDKDMYGGFTPDEFEYLNRD